MTEHDRDAVLSMLMDVSGTTKRVDNSLDILKDLGFYGKESYKLYEENNVRH